MKKLISLSLLIAFVTACTHNSNTSPGTPGSKATTQSNGPHILWISVDGMHAVDLQRYVQQHPQSTLAALADAGTIYTNAMTSAPSDSFPGTAGMITGASPKTHGIYYDVSYDRALSPAGSNCATLGAIAAYDESADINPNALDAGGGLDPNKLPRDPKHGCAPVYPHQFLRVNTVFEVVKAHGGVTAWSDKHPAYDFLNGPSGHGVDDLFNPEINVPGITDSVAATQTYDGTKVQAVLNQIRGLDHIGGHSLASVPTLFGMNFQALSVAQKLAGYQDAEATPSAGVQTALNFVDHSLGQMVAALIENGSTNSTTIIITAKHGQNPIDPSKKKIISDKNVPALINGMTAGLVAQATLDDIGLIWLTDRSRTSAVTTLMNKNATALGIQETYSGQNLIREFGIGAGDSRAPDLILQTEPGVIYASAKATKFAEHGGLSDDDRHVALLVMTPGSHAPASIDAPVELKQVAPTILHILGIAPSELQGVVAESTEILPGIAGKTDR